MKARLQVYWSHFSFLEYPLRTLDSPTSEIVKQDEDNDLTPIEIGEAIPMEEDYSSKENGEEDDDEDEI